MKSISVRLLFKCDFSTINDINFYTNAQHGKANAIQFTQVFTLGVFNHESSSNWPELNRKFKVSVDNLFSKL